MEIKRGELYYADLSPVVGSEQGGVRPVLVVQNDVGNKYSPTVIAAAVTSRLTKARLPTHIEIAGQASGLQKDSVIVSDARDNGRGIAQGRELLQGSLFFVLYRVIGKRFGFAE